MKVWKIRRDAGPEDLTWDPPNLCFSIDRHGGTVMGSKRAERQTWMLNLQTLMGEQVVGFLNGDCGLCRIDVPVQRRSSRLDVQREPR